jgi:hypothetical protein
MIFETAPIPIPTHVVPFHANPVQDVNPVLFTKVHPVPVLLLAFTYIDLVSSVAFPPTSHVLPFHATDHALTVNNPDATPVQVFPSEDL